MKEKMLDYLICPDCTGVLWLTDINHDNDDVREGVLNCSICDTTYPLRDCIPRFIRTDMYADTFSFEWNKFYDVQIDILNNTDESERTFREKTGFRRDDAKGKLFLDAGVGSGRFAEVVSRWGAEVIGIDLSFAVDAAYKNIGNRENVHIIQADIFRMPFRRETFDHIYSIGVLHHTPDTKKAFSSLVPFLKRGGSLAVYIYENSPSHKYSDKWRRYTTRMNTKFLYYLSSLAIPAYYPFKIPLIGPRLHYWFPISLHANHKVRWLDTFDWYSPAFQWKHSVDEVKSWYEEYGFVDIEVYPFSVCIKGRKA
jgi:SAM-dependent methyltransferase